MGTAAVTPSKPVAAKSTRGQLVHTLQEAEIKLITSLWPFIFAKWEILTFETDVGLSALDSCGQNIWLHQLLQAWYCLTDGQIERKRHKTQKRSWNRSNTSSQKNN